MMGDGLLAALFRIWRHDRADDEGRSLTGRRRLEALLATARERSPFYAERCANRPTDAGLEAFPPVTKEELMARFDDWLTDPSVRLEDVRRFMSDRRNIGKALGGRYTPFATSGSTGSPAIVLYDRRAMSVFLALGAIRSLPRRADLLAMARTGRRTAGLYASGGFYLSGGSMQGVQTRFPWKKRQLRLVSVLEPLASIVRELNDFQPALLGGYPSALELLIDEAEEGRLRIAPAAIMAGGELLSAELRTRLAETFHCSVQSTYSCTEGGVVACECALGHLHVNEDWVIVEPVDANGDPVPDGVRSDKILLTNLANLIQPVIRYVVTDRIIMHREGCACGKTSPWLEIEGRSDDILDFPTDSGRVRISPLAIYACVRETSGLRRFQLVQHEDGRLELRIECAEGFPREKVFDEARSRLEAILAANGISGAAVSLSAEPPAVDPESGKYRHVLKKKA
jgi:phenylacetate-coenzyme A ligase PaaK-like adenylate-forming protein